MSCGSPTRGLFAGGYVSPTTVNTIEYITIATLGNGEDFGDLTVIRSMGGACSSATRGVFISGGTTPNANTDVIDYVTIATLGDAVDFGNLTESTRNTCAAGSTTRAVRTGGYVEQATMDYVQISTTGDALDFGDLVTAKRAISGLSNGHGGLG